VNAVAADEESRNHADGSSLPLKENDMTQGSSGGAHDRRVPTEAEVSTNPSSIITDSRTPGENERTTTDNEQLLCT
jgi:hypothetical protein